MRYSIFAGLPLAIIAMTAFYELAARFATYEGAVAGGLMLAILVPILLHRWDIARLRRLLHPPPHFFPIGVDYAMTFLIPILEEVQWQDAHGTYRWKLTCDPEHPLTIVGKLRMRTPVENPNIVAWLIDLVDKGEKPKMISMKIAFEQVDAGTRAQIVYDAPPLLDWSRLEEVIQENNRWTDSALLRACTSLDISG
jgi:hypothetical protein